MNMPQTLISLIQLRQAARRRYANPDQGTIARVAYAYAKQAFGGALYDVTARLIILEGAAGVKAQTWSANPREGLKKARQHFEEHLSDMDPLWFALRDTRMVSLLVNRLNRMLDTSGVPDMGGEDIVQAALVGMGAQFVQEDGSISYRKIKNKFWEVGKHLSARILSGAESPGKVATGLLSKNLSLEALNTIRKFRTRQKAMGPNITQDSPERYDRDNLGTYGQIEDQAPSRAGDAFSAIFFDRGKLGQLVRREVKQIIERDIRPGTDPTKGPRHTMRTWIEGIEKGEVLSGLALAQAAGYLDDPNARQNSMIVRVKKHWGAGMKAIFKGLRNNRRLWSAVMLRLDTANIDTNHLVWNDILDNQQEFGKVRYGSLHQAVVRLANQIPELRPHLIPLLRSV